MVEVIKKGPIFDRRLDKGFDKATKSAEVEIAEQGVLFVRNIIRAKAKTRTGRYDRAVRSTRVSGGMKIHDNNIVYGPWLEGVGSRNSRTSFRGYRQFRDSRKQIQRIAKPVVQKHVDTMLGGM